MQLAQVLLPERRVPVRMIARPRAPRGVSRGCEEPPPEPRPFSSLSSIAVSLIRGAPLVLSVRGVVRVS